jgi:hypothetical protein
VGRIDQVMGFVLAKRRLEVIWRGKSELVGGGVCGQDGKRHSQYNGWRRDVESWVVGELCAVGRKMIGPRTDRFDKLPRHCERLP